MGRCRPAGRTQHLAIMKTSKDTDFPTVIPNWINGREQASLSGRTFSKMAPAAGDLLCEVSRSDREDINLAVEAARDSQPAWGGMGALRRGMILFKIARAMEDHTEQLAGIVAEETGRSPKEAVGEVGAAIQCAMFYASEGQRFYGRTTTSGMEHRSAMTLRQPIGVAGLIIAANTPIANLAWKVFPALVCGNSVVLKAAEDTPCSAWYFGRFAKEAGIPDGVLNIVQGFGPEAGQPLVEHPNVGVVSFTGSTEVGRTIAGITAARLAKVSLELGGKNALVVADDCNLDAAVKWTLLSAFSNAGQRCAAASRIIVMRGVYGLFKTRLLEAVGKLKVGIREDCDFGAVINERQLNKMIEGIRNAVDAGASLLAGGGRITGDERASGFYMQPTVLEGVTADSDYCRNELFGPITALFEVSGFEEAIDLVNDSPYGLTACLHSGSLNRCQEFIRRTEVGVVSINAGTHGSEPHMPFGGRKQSGNGTREPSTEALDIYSNLKDVYTLHDPGMV